MFPHSQVNYLSIAQAAVEICVALRNLQAAQASGDEEARIHQPVKAALKIPTHNDAQHEDKKYPAKRAPVVLSKEMERGIRSVDAELNPCSGEHR